jgi:hypothetical protein
MNKKSTVVVVVIIIIIIIIMFSLYFSVREEHFMVPSVSICLLHLSSHYYNSDLGSHCYNYFGSYCSTNDLEYHCCLCYSPRCPADVIVRDVEQKEPLEF